MWALLHVTDQAIVAPRSRLGASRPWHTSIPLAAGTVQDSLQRR